MWIGFAEDSAFAALLFFGESLRHALARAVAKGNLPHMLMGKVQPPGDGGDESPHRVRSKESSSQYSRIRSGLQLSEDADYAQMRIESIQKTQLRVDKSLRPEIASAIRAARDALGYSQTELAQALGSSQDAISRWERGTGTPPISAITAMARIVPEEQKDFWIAAGAITEGKLRDPRGMRDIPVLRDPAAAGTPRDVNESEVDYILSMPRHLLPQTGRLFGLKVVGDSMSPLLEEGYIALVDVAQQKPEELEGRMVAARHQDGGVTIKWLCGPGPGLYLLVPQNTSHLIEVIDRGSQWTLVGEIIQWIGFPPARKKR
jgi:SOS-response transcriptional repressor LexA